jgi:hypothetical protein
MLEKVAAALIAEMMKLERKSDIGDMHIAGNPQALARAALEALREPDEATLNAAYDADSEYAEGTAPAEVHWQAMLSAILEGK